MSFSFDVKTELCKIGTPNTCCKKALLYGMLLFGRSFTPGEITMQTEHSLEIELASALLRELYSIRPEIKKTARAGGHAAYILCVREEAAGLFGSFGYAPSTVALRINRANIENDCCAAPFIRGVFLACGSVVEPKKDYHLEFVVPHFFLGGDFTALLSEQGFEPKALKRKGNYVNYFKESSQIEDLLTLMGAADKAMELMNIKIYRDFRNKANRATNCETANIEKTVAASTSQIHAIRKIIRTCGLQALEPDLQKVARLRVANPDMTLSEMGTALRMSRSGVNHRLRRIMEKSEKLTF